MTPTKINTRTHAGRRELGRQLLAHGMAALARKVAKNRIHQNKIQAAARTLLAQIKG